MTSKLQQLGIEVEKNPTYLGYVELSNEIETLNSSSQRGSLFRVGVLRNFTVEPLIPVLKGEFYLSGFLSEFYVGDFDTIASDAMNPSSGLYSFDPQMIILAQWFELLSPSISDSFIKMTVGEREDERLRLIQSLRSVLQSIRRNTKAPIIINNFPLTDKTTLGILDFHSVHSQKKWHLQFNEDLLKVCSEIDNVFCIDLAAVLSNTGYLTGFNQRQWEVAKAPLGSKLLIPLAKEYGKFLRALNGASRKCLILDCDGTLWGGILGEDGNTGIKIGSSYPGTSFRNFQQQILNLYNRGVILAICSKNNEEDVLDVLENHPSMILRKHHFANLKINWDDKATNILRIAKELNIGVDSLVFADDNEFECDWIKSQLPEVKVIHLKGDPALFQSVLCAPGYFDSLTFSEEDTGKTEMYQSENKRKELLVTTASYEDYLIELGIKAQIESARPDDLARVAQLTQKTNQFNLTTLRYTEDNIKELAQSKDSDIYTIKVSDKISDLGLIGVAIVRYEGSTMIFDSFLMSCRALGRGLERALLTFSINNGAERGATKVIGRYVPSKKNVQTQDFYNNNGFTLLEHNNDHTSWEFKITDSTTLTYPDWVAVNS
jgi:FkbH-like protein